MQDPRRIILLKNKSYDMNCLLIYYLYDFNQQTVKLIFFDSPIFQQKVTFTAIFVQTVNLFRRNETFALFFLSEILILKFFSSGDKLSCAFAHKKSRGKILSNTDSDYRREI